MHLANHVGKSPMSPGARLRRMASRMVAILSGLAFVVLIGCSRSYLWSTGAPASSEEQVVADQVSESVETANPTSGLPEASNADQLPENQEKTSSTNKEAKEMIFSSGHAVEHVTTEDFPSKVLQSPKPVLVDFYADWCPPCRMLAPVLQQVAQETDHVTIMKVNVDQEPRLASQYRVSAIPTLILFKDGQLVERITGFLPKHQLKQLLDQYK